MLSLILVWFMSSLALILTSKMVKGFELKSFGSAMWASLIIGFLNMILRPILILLTLPINIITLGLFTFVVNAIVLKSAAGLLKGFQISSWGIAILGAIVLAFIQMMMEFILPF
jgi:putative membrane protein